MHFTHPRETPQHTGHQQAVTAVASLITNKHGICCVSPRLFFALMLSFWPFSDRKWLRLTEDTHHKMPQMASETARVETPVVSPGPSECDCSNVSNGVRLRFYAQQASGFHLPPRYHGG